MCLCNSTTYLTSISNTWHGVWSKRQVMALAVECLMAPADLDCILNSPSNQADIRARNLCANVSHAQRLCRSNPHYVETINLRRSNNWDHVLDRWTNAPCACQKDAIYNMNLQYR